MKTNNISIGSLKIPLLLLGMVVIFSCGFHTVSAATPSTSSIYVSPAGSDSSNGQSATQTSTTVGPKKTVSSALSTVSNGGVVTLASGTYNVNNLVISKSMTINGAGYTKTVITGSNAGRILTIEDGATVTITGVTFENGKSTYGGAIHNDGTLNLKYSEFKNNYSPDYGGAVYNDGKLTSYYVTYTGNTAACGAGITNDVGGSMDIARSSFTYNHASGSGSGVGYGGAIYNNVGDTYLIYNSFSYNTGFEGATLYNCGQLDAYSNSFAHNTAVSDSGAIDTYHGVTTLSYDTFVDNHAGIFGGACYIDTDEGVTDTTLSELIVSHCSFTGNTAGLDGGAIHNYRGKLIISDTKFINNYAGRYGGALVNWYGSMACSGNLYTNNIAKAGSTINQWS
ncbi:hypothetical protein [Methanobacterium sp.]|uniref:hypothetical protein n=1 Tax=Methanobacterium sp. TaxID=2164 RepID=UPI003C71956D